MLLQIQSTEKITECGGVPCRVWTGTTPGGVPCIVFVHRIAVANAVDQTQFERELVEQMAPARYVPLRNVL